MYNNFFEKEDYGEEDILQLLQTGAEEGLHLEFKQAEAIIDTKEIAKDVAAMANAGGGIIIYGIAEEDHKAAALSFIDGAEYSKERLDQIISGNISRRVSGVTIHPIRFGRAIQNTIYLVKIPESQLAPHMANGKYYRRYNFTTNTMSEYEVRNAYLRIQAPLLRLELPHVKFVENLVTGSLYKLSTHISNVGSSIERFFKLELIIPKKLYSPMSSGDKSPLEQYKTQVGSNYVRIVIPNKEPIFQNETLKMPNGFLLLEEDKQLEDLKGIEYMITLKLYYTGGIIIDDFYLADILRASRIEE